jgi:hypothetical protein
MVRVWRCVAVCFVIVGPDLASTETLLQAKVLLARFLVLLAQFAQLVRLSDGDVVAIFSDKVTLLGVAPGTAC